jgi:hypothetical protein
VGRVLRAEPTGEPCNSVRDDSMNLHHRRVESWLALDLSPALKGWTTRKHLLIVLVSKRVRTDKREANIADCMVCDEALFAS